MVIRICIQILLVQCQPRHNPGSFCSITTGPPLSTMKIYLVTKEQKKLAYLLVRRAIRRKRLIPASTCQICSHDLEMLAEQTEENWDRFSVIPPPKAILYAHHHNYRKPLDVWWLCHSCHMFLHAAQRQYGQACITLDGAKKLLGNLAMAGNALGYEQFLRQEIDHIDIAILDLMKKVRQLKQKRAFYRLRLIELEGDQPF